ncbi:MAG TPA: glycosyltransferase family 1 protein [Chloroflexi bacterium]|nr:glycosyltransferase family 1 protein [Chloroflexota bacterium]
MRIGIDYTAAVRQRAGIGRYTRELVGALLHLPHSHRYILFAATGNLRPAPPHLAPCDFAPCDFAPCDFAPCDLRTVPLSDDWLARIWHRLRLPIPVEAVVGRVDLFYSPDFVLPPTLPRTRTVLTVHDLSFLHYPDHFVPKLVRYLESVVPRSVARADRVLADSEATRADLIRLLGVPPEKVEVLYSGVDPRFRPEPEPGERERLRARYGIGDQPYILSVGTLQPRKNFVRLIRAFARLRSAPLRLAPRLLIAGGRGWLYEEVLEEAERRGDRVRLLGFVDDADLPALYRNARLFVFPSFYEGFGLPVLEAMACGVPVVCSSASSLPEVAGDAALLVDPHDEEGLAAAMERALADETLRAEMRARGLQQAARFTWDRAARQLLSVFDQFSL